ncbi:MAG: urease subunit beta, partial [Muribaculaceae bacterium]|nr:urease subunit beta [Muribaculaceae bacterium]
ELVAYAGKLRVIGFDDLTNCYVGLEDSPTYYPKRIEAFRRMREYGYKCVSQTEAEGEYTETEIKKD